MKGKKMSKFKIILLVVGLIFMGSGLSKAQECLTYLELIEKYMPEGVGNQAFLEDLLKVEPYDWTEKIDVPAAFEVLKEDSFEGQSLQGYPIGILINDHSIIKYNLVRGEIRYINRQRKFDPGTGEAYDYEKGKVLVENLIQTLGIPTSEILRVEGKVLKGAAARLGSIQPEKQYDIETTYFFSRMIRETAVITSTVVAAVSNKGEISRCRVRWPALKIDPGLQRPQAISREEVRDMVHKTMVENQGCVSLERFGAYIAYVPSTYDVQDEDDTPEVAREKVYAPRLVIFYRPENQEEGGEELIFDLLR